MKKFLAMAAVAALAAGASAYAANPFSDVSTSDWAYQAVADLSDQGIVEGYPDGTFKGQTNITRYEMAQIIARLMAREDQYNAEQRATIDKLAGEYADELDSLGVRVSNLEKKVGNISWSGDARMQYQDHGDFDKDSYTGRLRVNVSGQVNDQVRVEGRLVTEMGFTGNEDVDDGNTTMDRIHVVYTPSDEFTFDLGRTGVGLSQTGIFMDEDGIFDGVAAAYDNGRFNLGAGYGRFKDMEYTLLDDQDKEHNWALYKNEAWFVKAGVNAADKAALSAFYLQYAKDSLVNDNVAVYGVGAAAKLGSKFTLDGDYIKHADDITDDASMWTAGLTYGEVDTDKVGTFSLGFHYADMDAASYVGGNSAWDMTDLLDYGIYGGAKFWQAKLGVAVAKGVELDAYYYFAGESKNSSVEDPDDVFGVELNYAF